MFYVRDVDDPDVKEVVCDGILRALPEWFGIESAIVRYAKEVRELPFIAAYRDNEAAGFLAIKEHNAYTAEICVLGVLKAYHRAGAGRAMVGRCDEICRARGREFLTVKTLADTNDDPGYEKTRLFYGALGFRPLEVFPLLWDEDNPCLFMAKRL